MNVVVAAEAAPIEGEQLISHLQARALGRAIPPHPPQL